MSDQDVGRLQAEVARLRDDLSALRAAMDGNSADTRRMLDIVTAAKGVRWFFLGLLALVGAIAAAVTAVLSAWNATH